MKIAFVGMGSIAKRHFGNVTAYLSQHEIPFEIDIFRSGKGAPLPPEIAAKTRSVRSADEILTPADRYDVVFVTNPTANHYETVAKFAQHTRSFFVEKPVFDRADPDLAALNIPEDVVCYVACPLRYNAVLQYAKERINMAQVFSARAICSSYLPDWRPGADYRTCYSAHRDMGGGVAIDLIHEWDYLTWLMGFPQKVSYFGGTYSGLEIDSDDLAVYTAQYPHRVVELHLDYFGRKSQRKLELFTATEVITLDLLAGTVSYEHGKHSRTEHFSAARNQFQTAELSHFFDILANRIPNDNTLENALRVLRLAKKGEL